jgi:hypothetical protein
LRENVGCHFNENGGILKLFANGNQTTEKEETNQVKNTFAECFTDFGKQNF